MTQSGLFDVGPADGATVAVMRSQLQAWQAAGRAVAPVVRRALIDQAHAVDLARSASRATQISGASRVLLELLQGFHLVDDAPPGRDDPFDAFVARVEAAANAGHDDGAG
jgi:hypothetical protein